MTPITHEEMRAAVLTVIADAPEGGNTVYERPVAGRICRYVWEGQPSCLIGKAFVLLGVDIEVLSAKEGLIPGHVVPLSPLAKGWASRVQYDQDAGETWGTAVEMADRLWASAE